MAHSRKWFGPGFLVTAAFIGPGTVTTASQAGAGYGVALLWAVVFATIATIVLQEMSARLGLVTRAGLGEALRTTFAHPALRAAAAVLVVGAIAFGNAAFQMGNIMGTAIGLELLTGAPMRICGLLVGVAAALLLSFGRYLLIERLLTGLVALMGCTFLITAIVARPDWNALAAGLWQPVIPAGSAILVVGLIGTTVVPYNLFLHASAVQEKWPAALPLRQSLRAARIDSAVSITAGGLITMAILVTASALHASGGGRVDMDSAAAMAAQLEPLLGAKAKACFALGLIAAGFTSALTAPLAAAYATAGVLGFSGDTRSAKFRAVWVAILAIGTLLALLGTRPVQAIIVAQVVNGVLLPVVAVFLLIVVNRRRLLGEHRNRAAANLLGGLVVLVAAALGVFQVLKALHWPGA